MDIDRQMQANTQPYCLYARVSSREQEREGYSIEAQLKSCKQYAVAHNLKIVKEYVDIESAKDSGRKKFNEMIEFLKENENVGIACEKVDRLYRNWKDYITLDDLKTTLIFVKENSIVTPDSRASEKFFLGIRVLMARNYIDNLSDEIKKGCYEKFAQGGYPRKAPLGYINDKNTRTILVDPKTSPFIVKMFELYASGRYTLAQISNVLYEDGLRTRSGKRVVKGSIHRMIQESFYYGLMQYNGKHNKGNHKALISKKLFDQANDMLNNKSKVKAVKHDFALKGRLRCGSCGCTITAETQRGHVYYRCTHSKPCPEKKYVREETLSEEISLILADLQMDNEFIEIMIQATREAKKDELDYNINTIESLNKQHETIKRRLSKLLDSHIDDTIPLDLFEQKKDELLKEKAEVETQMVGNETAHDVSFEQLEKVLKVAHVAQKLFKVGDNETKQILLSLISSNILVSEGKILSYQLNPLFSYLLKNVKEGKNVILSGREDLNLRPHGPKPRALAN